MRSLVVLALLKCAATSVIDPANHKTVSVPIGNGMNVDIDVTVDIDTSGTGTDVEPNPSPQCAKHGRNCETSSDCCGKEAECKQTTGGPRGELLVKLCYIQEKQGQCAKLEEGCDMTSDCCEKYKCNKDQPPNGTWVRGFCFLPDPSQCAKLGTKCYDYDCCDKEAECKLNPSTLPYPLPIEPSVSSYLCTLPEQCKEIGKRCETDSDCCDKDAECQEIKIAHDYDIEVQTVCMEKEHKQRCADLQERCSVDTDCCDDEAVCKSPFGLGQFCVKEEQEQCKDLGQSCKSSSECCGMGTECKKGDGWTKDYGDGDICLPTCLPDGELCHGTDDWEHKCCSEACCEGKCGACKDVLWKHSYEK